MSNNKKTINGVESVHTHAYRCLLAYNAIILVDAREQHI